MSSKARGKSYPRDIAGLRDALFDEIEDIRDGHSSPHEAVAFCSLAESVLETYACELKARAFQMSMQEKQLQIEERRLDLANKRNLIDHGETYDDHEEKGMQLVRRAN
jgi:hypothetical protein